MVNTLAQFKQKIRKCNRRYVFLILLLYILKIFMYAEIMIVRGRSIQKLIKNKKTADLLSAGQLIHSNFMQ